MPVELRYEFRGKRGSPALVFSGSLGTDLTMWEPQAELLKPRFCTLRYDIRGHGRSAVPPGPYSIDDLGSDLVALLDRLGIERASLCGLSIGGMISMWVAAHAPERVDRLVLCCTSAQLGPRRVLARAGRDRPRRGRRGDRRMPSSSRWFTAGFAAAHPDVIERMRGHPELHDRERVTRAAARRSRRWTLRADLPSITAPTLVIAGAAGSRDAARARPADRGPDPGSAI